MPELLFEGSQREVAEQQKSVYRIAARFGGIKAGAENGMRGYQLTFGIAYIRDWIMNHYLLGESFETSVPWSRALALCDNVKRRIREEHAKRGLPGAPFVTCRVTQVYDTGVWTEEVLRSPTRSRGLEAGDFMLVRNGTLRASVALWDQRSFKQSIVRDYGGQLARWRAVYNLAAPLMRRPRLPAPGARLESAYLSHLNASPDDPDAVVALVAEACREAAGRGLDYVMLGLDEANPLCAVLRARFPTHSYVSMVYVVYWEDGAGAAAEIDERMLHPEVAIL